MAYGKVRVDQIQSSTRTVDVDNLATTAVATTSVAGLLSATDKTKLDGVATGAEVNVNADWNAGSGDAQILNKPTLGTAAAKNTGTAAGNVVELDGSARLPAVDGSLLTGLVAATDLTYTAATRLLASSTGTDVTLPLFSSTDAGLAPASSGGTTNFLRADGTFAAPPGGSTDLSYTAATRLLASSTGTDVTLPLFSSTDAGLTPASSGGTTNFLRADGTFAAPPGGSPGGSTTQVQFNNAGAFGGDADLTWNSTTNVLGVTGDVNLSDGGSFTTTLQCITPTAARTVSIPDSTGTVALVAGSSGQTLYNLSGAVAGSSTTFDATTGTRFVVPFGYGAGAGGTVTQATNKATGVTLNTRCGQVTLNGAALAANTTVSFVLTNSQIAAGDVLILNHISGGTAGSYLLNARSAAGSATIDVRNITAGSLSEAVVIAFAVIKATTT